MVANMIMTSPESSQSRLRSPAALPLPIHITEILSNWSVPSISEILPTGISANTDLINLSDPLFLTLHELSCLTVGQRERAHSLLNTYFQCRIREGSYSGKLERIYASLETSDVEQAIGSLRKMMKGLRLEKEMKRKMREEGNGGEEREEGPAEKRRKNPSHQHHHDDDEDVKSTPSTKTSIEKANSAKNSSTMTCQNQQSPLISLRSPSLSPSPTTIPSSQTTHTLLTPYTTKQRRPIIQLPPLNTSIAAISNAEMSAKSNEYPVPTNSTLEAVINHQTNNSDLGSISHMPSIPTEEIEKEEEEGGRGSRQKPILTNPDSEPYTSVALVQPWTQHPHTIHPPPPPPHHRYHRLHQKYPAIQAAHLATHEFHMRQKELYDAERWYTGKRRGYIDAKRRMEGAVRRARKYL